MVVKMAAKQLTEAGREKMSIGGLKRKEQLIKELGGYENYVKYMQELSKRGNKIMREKYKEKLREWSRLGGITTNRKYPLLSRIWKSLGGSNSVKSSPRKKIIGPQGERMYNLAEKTVAEYLLRNNLHYQYEPRIKAGDKILIPDFLLDGNIVIEVTTNERVEKFLRLAYKFNLYKKNGFEKIILFTTKKCEKFLKFLPNFVEIKFLEDISSPASG